MFTLVWHEKNEHFDDDDDECNPNCLNVMPLLIDFNAQKMGKFLLFGVESRLFSLYLHFTTTNWIIVVTQ